MPRRNRRQTKISTVSLELRECLFCNAEFMPNRNWQKYCCVAHSTAAHWQRKHGDPAKAIPIDAPPRTVAKLEEFEEIQLNKLTATAEKVLEVEQKIPKGITPAAKALSKLGYDPYAGIPELKEGLKDERTDGTATSTTTSGSSGPLTAEEEARGAEQKIGEAENKD